MSDNQSMSAVEWINYIRQLMDAVISGRIEARDVRDMTDEAHAAYKAKLKAEADAEVERGKALDNQ